MSRFVQIANSKEIQEGQGFVLQVGSLEVALFRADRQLYAIENSCPHRGGPLGEGILDGNTILCPWHGWGFDLITGKCLLNPQASVRCFQVREQDNSIEIEI